MNDEKQQEWHRIAEQASREQDPARLIELTNKLSELLGDRDDDDAEETSQVA